MRELLRERLEGGRAYFGLMPNPTVARRSSCRPATVFVARCPALYVIHSTSCYISFQNSNLRLHVLWHLACGHPDIQLRNMRMKHHEGCAVVWCIGKNRYG